MAGNNLQYDAINFVAFNQDYSCVSVGTRNGYKIYNCEPFGKCYSRYDGGMGIVEMLFSTSLLALVGMGDQPLLSPRRLHITNTKRHTTICELTFPTSILAVKLNRKKLIVLLEEQIYIYDISNMKLIHTIETSPNPTAIIALSPSSQNAYLAYPSPLPIQASPFSIPQQNHPNFSSNSLSDNSIPNSTGDVVLFDTNTLQPVNVLEAHKSPLSSIAINSTGTLLATASEKGTIIRIFSVPASQKLYQFRRGSYATRIYCMSFNASSTLLAVSSASDTIHIFKLISPNDRLLAFGATQRSLTSNNDSLNQSSNSQFNTPVKKPINSFSNTETNNLTSLSLTNPQSSSIARSVSTASNNSTDSVGSYANINSPVHRELTPPIESLSDIRKRNGTVSSMLRRSSQTIGKSVAEKIGGYLPTTFTEMWEPSRDFAYVKLPSSGVKSIVALSPNSPQIMVVTSEGSFFQYNIDLENGGECSLIKQYSLLDSNEDF